MALQRVHLARPVLLQFKQHVLSSQSLCMLACMKQREKVCVFALVHSDLEGRGMGRRRPGCTCSQTGSPEALHTALTTNNHNRSTPATTCCKHNGMHMRACVNGTTVLCGFCQSGAGTLTSNQVWHCRQAVISKNRSVPTHPLAHMVVRARIASCAHPAQRKEREREKEKERERERESVCVCV